MTGQCILNSVDRGYAPVTCPADIYQVGGSFKSDRAGESWSDCWPDNASSDSLPPLSREVLEANSPRRVLLECGAVISVAAIAALLANLFI